MPRSARFQLRFEPPQNGWLPLVAVAGDTQLSFAASDVPNNCIEELVAALWAAARGDPAQVFWHLEPEGYYFYFLPRGELLQLRIAYEEDYRGTQCDVLSVEAKHRDLLLPLWRSLRQFQSFAAVEPHWPPVQFGDLDLLKRKITGQACTN